MEPRTYRLRRQGAPDLATIWELFIALLLHASAHGRVGAAAVCGYCERRVATASQHSCVIVGSSYTAVCSGDDTAGTGKLTAPTIGWQSITAGDTFTCGLSFGGTATCWGALPTVTINGSYAIPGTYQDGAAGARHWCGIAWNSSAVCLGDCSSGVCAPPPGLQLVHISGGSDYACGVSTAGSVVCWGGARSGVPAATPSITTVVRVAAGGGHACALLADGSATCWGANSWGQATPPPGAVFNVLAAGANATCGVKHDGGMICWGNALARAIPPQFVFVSDNSTSALEISCAALQCCGLAATGYTLCWPLAVPVTAATYGSGMLGTSWYVATLAGATTGNNAVVDGSATATRFVNMFYVAADSNRLVYVADYDSGVIRRVNATGYTTTIDSCNSAHTRGVVLNANETRLYFSCTGSTVFVMSVAPAIGSVTVLAGSGISGMRDGAATSARFDGPTGIAVLPSDVIYVADTNNNAIRMIADGIVSLFAGSSTGNYGRSDGSGTNAKFRSPFGIVFVSGVQNAFFVSDFPSNTIRRVALAGAVVTTFAGIAYHANGLINGAGTAALFATPYQLAAHVGGGALYVADCDNNAIRLITLPDANVTTPAGSTTAGYLSNTGGATSRWSCPNGVAITDIGELFTSEIDNKVLRRMNAMMSETATVPCPTPSPSVTPSITPSSTSTGSPSRSVTGSPSCSTTVTATSTATPSKSTTATASPSTSATITATSSMSASASPTPSLTPSPTTPPMTLDRVLPDTPPPPFNAAATGTLWLVGQAFRSGGAGPTLSTSPPGVIPNMMVVNSTHLRLTCNATVWYWSTALLTVTQLGYNASVTKPLYVSLSLITMARGAIPYGTPLQLAAPLLGAAVPARITLQPPAPAVPITCSFVRAVNNNITECTPWLAPDAALGVPLTLSLLLSVGAPPIALPSSLTVTIARPTLTLFRNGPAVVPAAGKATVHAGLAPVTARLPCNSAVWTTAGLQPPVTCPVGGRTWQRAGVSNYNSTWTYALPVEVGGVAPAESHVNTSNKGGQLRVALLAGATRMSLAAPATTPYAAATVQAVSPAVVAAVECGSVGLAGTTCAPPATFNITGTVLGYANGVARIANVTLAGVPCSCTPLPSAPQTLATCAWPGAVLDAVIEAAAPTADAIPLPLSFVAAGAVAPIVLPTDVIVAIRPHLAAVVPPLAQAGTQLTVSIGSSEGGSTEVDATSVTVGGVPCTDVAAISSGTVTCTAPALSPLLPGYPRVAVAVVGTSGLGAATIVNISYTSPFTLDWVGTPPSVDNATVVLPSGRAAGTLQPWPTVPTLRVSGVGSGSCWVEAVTVAPVSSPPTWANNATGWVVSNRDVTAALAAGLVGTTTARVALDGGAPSADVAFAAAGVTGGSGTAAALTGSCIDAEARTTTTSTSWHVALPTLAAAWDASSAALLAAPLPPVIMDASAVATVAWVGVAGNASAPPYSDAARQMSCTAAVYPAGAGVAPPGLGLTAFLAAAAATDASFWSSATGAVVEPGCEPTALPPDAPPALCWRAAFGALSLAAAPLGTNVTLAAECEWVPTGERIQLPVLHGVVVTAVVAWSLPAASSMFMDTPATTTAAIVHNALPAYWAAAAPLCQLAVRSGDARLTALAAAAEYGADGSGSVTPAVSVEATGLPHMTVSVVLVCRVWGVAVESSERSIIIQQLHLVPVRLPTTYLPSDGTTALLLDPPPSLRLVDDDGAGVDGVTCSLAAASNGAEARNIDSSGAAQVVTTSGGWLNFTAAVVVSSFGVPSAALAVACSRVTPDAPEPVSWTATLTRLTLDVCEPLAPVTDASNGVPPWHIGIAVDGVSACVSPQTAVLPPAARQSVACAVTPLVTADDAGGVTADGAFQLFVVDGTVHGAAADGSMTFDALQLIGSRGVCYNVSVACTLGAVAIPTPQEFPVQVLPCAAGSSPSGMFCTPCPAGTYTRGDNEQACLPCPTQGADCSQGLLVLQPNFYRALEEAGTPVGPTSQLLPCYNEEACIVNITAEVYACAPGYSGALCGVCDGTHGYGSFDGVCRQCWHPGVADAALAVVAVTFVAAMALIALNPWMQAHDDSAVALKLLIGFVQAVAALSVFTAGGVALFRPVFGWTAYTSTNPLSLGGLRCRLQWGYLTRFIAVVALPPVGVAVAAAVVAVLAAAQAIRWRYRVLPVAWTWSRARARWLAWVGARRHTATLVFMAFLCYMPIVSTSFTTLMCIAAPVDGAYWLVSDLGVQCYVGQHAIASVLAVVVLAVFGLGTPSLVLWVLGRATPSMLRDPAFSNAYAFLYEGYVWAADVKARAAVADADVVGSEDEATPPRFTTADELLRHAPTASVSRLASFGRQLSRSLVWWEAVVMLRKAAVIMLATIVTNQFYQVVGAVLLFAGAVAMQQHFNPYARPLFNHLELLSLLDLYVTAAVSTMMLPATAAPRNVVRQPATWEMGLTASLVAINGATTLALAATLVYTIFVFMSRVRELFVLRPRRGLSVGPMRPNLSSPSLPPLPSPPSAAPAAARASSSPPQHTGTPPVTGDATAHRIPIAQLLEPFASSRRLAGVVSTSRIASSS